MSFSGGPGGSCIKQAKQTFKGPFLYIKYLGIAKKYFEILLMVPFDRKDVGESK